MKTTLDLPDELLLLAKRTALERGITLRALVEEALERAIGARGTRWPPLATVTYGDPSQPIDLDAAVLAAEANADTDSPEYVAKRLGLERKRR